MYLYTDIIQYIIYFALCLQKKKNDIVPKAL